MPRTHARGVISKQAVGGCLFYYPKLTQDGGLVRTDGAGGTWREGRGIMSTIQLRHKSGPLPLLPLYENGQGVWLESMRRQEGDVWKPLFFTYLSFSNPFFPSSLFII